MMKIFTFSKFLNESNSDKITVRKGKFDGMFQRWNVSHSLFDFSGINLYTKPGRNGVDQVHIELPERLQRKGFSSQILKELIQKNGSIYSAFGRRINPIMDMVHGKLANDPDVEHIRYEELGDLYFSKGIDPTRKKRIKDSLDKTAEYWKSIRESVEMLGSSEEVFVTGGLTTQSTEM